MESYTWEELEALAEQARAEAPARVARTVWAPCRATWDDPRPFRAERGGAAAVTKPYKPSARSNAAEFGYDAHGQLVSATRFAREGGEDVASRLTIVTPTQNGRRYFTFGRRGLIRVERLWLERVADVTRDGWTEKQCLTGKIWDSEETYVYDAAGRLTEIVTLPRKRYLCHYDAAGELARLDVAVGAAAPYPVYRRTSHAELEAARALVEAELPDRIATWAHRTAPDEPLYGLAIQFPVDDPTNAFLCLGLAREADRAGGDDIWNAAGFPLLDDDPAELNDPRFADAWERLAQDWRSREDWRGLPALLLDVTRRLAERDWSALQRDAPAFAVYAIGDEGGPVGLSDPVRRVLEAL